jgi:hypothetical protein
MVSCSVYSEFSHNSKDGLELTSSVLQRGYRFVLCACFAVHCLENVSNTLDANRSCSINQLYESTKTDTTAKPCVSRTIHLHIKVPVTKDKTNSTKKNGPTTPISRLCILLTLRALPVNKHSNTGRTHARSEAAFNGKTRDQSNQSLRVHADAKSRLRTYH